MKHLLVGIFLKRQIFSAAVVLTVLALLTYANIFKSPFIFDDDRNITENPLIRMTEITPEALTRVLTRVLKCPSPFRPLANLSFAANYFLHGYDVWGYHAVNLIIHMITALMVFLVTRQTLALCQADERLVPFFAAALWLVNPLHTQSVTYIVQRMNSMAAMFFMLALFCFIRGRINAETGQPRYRSVMMYIFCLMATVSGLASKQIVAVLPLILLLYEWFFFQNLDRAWLRKQLPWMGILILAFVVLIIIYLGHNPLETLGEMYEKKPFTMKQRLLTEAGIVIYYISLLVFPYPGRLIMDYDFPLAHSLMDPMATIPAIVALIMLLIAAANTARRNRLISFAICWFLITLLIESTVIGVALIFEHRTYLPSVFPIIGLTFLISRLIRPRGLALASLSLTIVVCGLWTYQRNTTWQNALDMWRDNIAKSPSKARPYDALGSEYTDLDEFDTAMTYFKRSLARSTPQEYQHAVALCKIGELLVLMDQPREAAAYLKNAVMAFPEYCQALINYGAALILLGQTDEAIMYNQRALAINPYLEKAYNNLGNAWFKKGEVPLAVSALRQAMALNPTYSKASNNLATILSINKRYGGMIDLLKQAVRQDPQDPHLAYQLARTSQASGMTDQAILWYKQALSLDPDQPTYLNALGESYVSAGRLADAAKALERLARQLPDNPTVFYNLACLYARQEDRYNAVENLKRAVENGYDNREHLRNDKDLEKIHDTDYYKNFIQKSLPTPQK